MYKQIAANKRNTVLLMVGFVAIVSLIGGAFAWWFDDWYVVIYTLVIATAYAAFQYYFASNIAVAMAGAKEIKKSDNPRLWNVVENLSITSGLPMPKVYIIEDSAPNAFASGRDPKHALVAATTGLIDIMDKEELTAVMAHEMSHIKNYDIRVSMITFGLVCIIGYLSDIGVRMLYYSGRRDNNDRSPVGGIIVLLVSILAPIAAAVAQMAVSREREYLADVSAVKLTRYPEGMISALKKLGEQGRPMKRQNAAAEAMYINSPLKKGFFSRLFSTHPPIEERIERLENAKISF